jgi:hypothetical protein
MMYSAPVGFVALSDQASTVGKGIDVCVLTAVIRTLFTNNEI